VRGGGSWENLVLDWGDQRKHTTRGGWFVGKHVQLLKRRGRFHANGERAGRGEMLLLKNAGQDIHPKLGMPE